MPKEKKPTKTTRRRVPPLPNLNPFSILLELTDIVGKFYAEDGCRAGVVLSHLADGRHYVSVARYQHGGKTVIASLSHHDPVEALTGAAKIWADTVRPPPREKLIADLDRVLDSWKITEGQR